MNEFYPEYSDPVVWPYYVAGGFVLLLVFALLINTIQEIFERVSPDLRSMNQAQLWVTIIPFFGSIWIFYVVYQLSIALREEFKRRKLVEFETSPGLGIGWAFCFFTLTAQLVLSIGEPVSTVLFAIVAVILLILYWTRIIALRAKLENDNRHHVMSQNAAQMQQTPFQYYVPPPAPQAPPPHDFPPTQESWERWKPK